LYQTGVRALLKIVPSYLAGTSSVYIVFGALGSMFF